MSLKLSVSNVAHASDASRDYLFQEERITIGRGQANHLTLPAPRQVVSTEHAVVENTGETCQLISCSNDNVTYLNDQSISASTPHDLNEGDAFRIGDFRIEVHFSDESAIAEGEGESGIDENPFDEPVRQLIEALEMLTEAYEGEAASQRREEALADAFCNAHGPVSSHEAVQRSIGLLEGDPADPPGSDAASSEEEKANTNGTQRPSLGQGASESSVLDTLTDALATVLKVPGEFQSEFLGHLLAPPSEAEFLYEGNGTAIKQHLVDSTLSEDEQGRRLEYVEEAADSIALHQIAMLEGYKASVVNGTEELLARLDPGAHRDDVVAEYDVLDYEVLEYVPVFTSPVVLERIREEWNELIKEDWSVAEQRIFRPAFAKAYLSRMGMVHSSDHSGKE